MGLRTELDQEGSRVFFVGVMVGNGMGLANDLCMGNLMAFKKNGLMEVSYSR